ncbi:MAG: adenosylmethionine decarboxylase [Armatimonadetes bacterium]|nr:adenosylmethionine decarboxylase [Armatimonadota bacterium]
MSITQVIASVFVVGALAPLTALARPNLLDRIKRAFKKQNLSVALAPEPIRTTEGWQLIQCEDSDTFRDWLGRDEKGLPFKEGELPSLGSHLLVEMFGCDPETIKFEDGVADAMLTAARNSEATIVADSFHEFKPFGVSGAVVIQESHYTIHTWPEYGYAAVDLFYCGGTISVHNAVDLLEQRFKPQRMKFLVVRRGMQDEVTR